jgi:hypothetical protein
MESWEIGGYTLEYDDASHTYVCEGIIVPSVTQMLKFKFGNKYASVDPSVLQKASEEGTKMHQAIENLCKNGEKSDLVEVRGFQFLQNHYKFEVLQNEVPVILSKDGEPICAGRLDMVIKMDGQVGLADLKRTYVLDKEYLGYQLNLYRIAYQQTYGEEIEFLRGIHLRELTRKYVTIPIKEEMAWEFINEYERSKEDGDL